jgi:hypothetical protein
VSITEHMPEGGALFPASDTMPLWLMTVALLLAAWLGVPIILRSKLRFFYSYWQCLPVFFAFMAALLWELRNTEDKAGRPGLLLAGFALLTLSPFPTWNMHSGGNLYLELCSIAALAAAFWLQIELSLRLQEAAARCQDPVLALMAKKTRFLVLCLEIIPVSAVYASALIAYLSMANRGLDEIFMVWKYGRISLTLRVCIFWGLLNSLSLCLYACYKTWRESGSKA